MTFGEKVKAERTKLGITQEELAAKIGVTVRVICSYENDKSRPRGTERYKKLAEALDVNVNYLLSEDDAFIAEVEDEYGCRGARQAQELLAEVTGLFAGGEMADEDMREMVDAIQPANLIPLPGFPSVPNGCASGAMTRQSCWPGLPKSLLFLL